MGVFSIQQGVEINIENQCFILFRKITDNIWQLENSRTKQIIERTDDQLRNLYANGYLTFSKSETVKNLSNFKKINLVNITPDQWEQAKVRRAYVIPALNAINSSNKLTPIINKVWESLRKPKVAPNPITVMRWKKRYIESGNDIVSLVDHHHQKGNRTKRYPEEVIQLVDKAVEKIFLALERNTIQDVIDHLEVVIENENQLRPTELQLPLPKRKLIRRTIQALPAFDVCVARYGRTAALNRFRSVMGHKIATVAPLEYAEIDDTPLDLIVIDDANCLPLGRPWVTLCIDDYSRCVLGVHISFVPPSYRTVSHCLLDAFCPKTNLKERFPIINNEWPMHGVMGKLSVDHALAYHSVSLENACYSMGTEIHYCPRKKPWFKGKIERYIKTFNDGIAHGTPGTTFRNIFEKGEYDPSTHAIVRVNTLQAIIRKWIVDYYHQKPHRALGAPPAIIWQSSIKPEDILLSDDLTQIKALLGRSEKRTLTHKGIELNGLFYNSGELTELRKRHGDKLHDIDIRFDESNLGNINVLSPDNTRIITVPAISFDYANGLTSWQHKVCKQFAAREMKKYDPMSWLQAKYDIARLIEEEFMFKRHKTRKKMAQFLEKPIADVQSSPPKQHSLSQSHQKPSPYSDQSEAYITDISPDKQPGHSKKFKAVRRDRSSSSN